ncbi:MAG: hypothetical protein LBI15_09920 [Dysgonamonadaceae bacterium]|jgi:hypothetical protein|nr:hypothetical protein [Dysgonamonadaceae bacterium]
MKKILFTLTILATLLFASSCQSDWDNGFKGGGTTDKDGFLLNLNVSNSSINTRMNIPSEEGEDDINVLHLLFFQGSGAQTFVDAVEIKDEDGYPLDLSMPLQVRFQNTPTLNNNTHYRILVVANIDAYIPTDVDTWLNSFNGVNFSTAVSEQIDVSTVFNGTNNQIASNRLLMTATVEKLANREEVSVPLMRAVVRLDVEMATRLAADYTLVSASVWNVPRETSIWNATYNNYSNIIPGRDVLRVDGVVGNTIKGQLYTFGNRQNQVSQNDLRTTAVVLGIEHNGVISYYRVNVSLPFAGQDLMRNTVHNITVNHVLGDGVKVGDLNAATPEEAERVAYGRNNSLLQVTVNNTDMDSRGVILIDGGNVLVIPTNRIVFSPEGGMREFTIFTYSPDGSARLAATNITMDTGLSTILSGNSLTVSATPSVDERKGIIELIFGNIRARIDVVQESSTVEFLELNLNMNDISAFSNGAAPGTTFPIPMATPDGLPNFVQVTASSEWVATMYNDEYFGFFGTTSRMIFGDPDNINTFQVQALQENEEMNTRYGFVIVSLVSNPNINRVLVLRQEGTDIVSIFAYGDPTVELLTTEERTTYFNAGGVLVTNRGSGTNRYRITHSVAGLLPGDAGIFFTAGGAHFTITERDETTPGVTILTVESNGINPMDGSPLTGRIGLRSPQGGFAAINLEQDFYTLTLEHSTPHNIPITGGKSVPVTVDIESTLTWSATIAMSNNTATDGTGRRLVQHAAKFVDQYGNTLVEGQNYPSSTQFLVEFPKVYYPNRHINISATVTVKLVGTSLQRTFTAHQNRLDRSNQQYAPAAGRNQVVAMNLRGSGADYGVLSTGTGGWAQGWSWLVLNTSSTAIPTTFITTGGGTGTATTTSLNATDLNGTNFRDVNLLNVVALGASTVATVWTRNNGVNEFIDSDRGWVVFSQQNAGTDLNVINMPTSPIRRNPGYPSVLGRNSLTTTPVEIYPDHVDTKIQQFFLGNGIVGKTPLTSVVGGRLLGQWGAPNAWYTYMNVGDLPPSAVITHRGISNSQDALLVVDVENGFMFLGEAQIFGNSYAATGGNMTEDQIAYRDNVAYFIGNAARYGTHFTDMFMEEGRTGRFSHSQPQPAPWSSYWDASGNNGTDNRGVPTKGGL